MEVITILTCMSIAYNSHLNLKFNKTIELVVDYDTWML